MMGNIAVAILLVSSVSGFSPRPMRSLRWSHRTTASAASSTSASAPDPADFFPSMDSMPGDVDPLQTTLRGVHESETLDDEDAEECSLELELAPLSLLGGFARGEDLAEVRHTVNCLQARFNDAIEKSDFEEAAKCREAITQAQEQDPFAKYKNLRSQKLAAENRHDIATMERVADQMRVVKHYLPQYGLEGLWVGRSGALKKQVIRISYENNLLVGTRVYSDNIVPSGEVIFKVKVSPDAVQPQPIDVAHVTDPRLKKLERFSGEGRVVDRRSKSTHWLPGQLILVGDYFAFAWLPINLQIFFMRVPDNITSQLMTLEEDRESLNRLMDAKVAEGTGMDGEMAGASIAPASSSSSTSAPSMTSDGASGAEEAAEEE